MSVSIAESKIATGIPFRRRALHHRHQRLLVHRRQHDSGHAPVDHRVDDLDLAAGVDLERRRVPVHRAAELAGRFDRARMHRLPENVAGAFGDYADYPLLAPPASRRYQDRGQ